MAAGDVLAAHRDAFEINVRPIFARPRSELGVEADPVEALPAATPKSAAERGTTTVESVNEHS